jgi:tetratricopeptide (TPR) repeat protein
MTGKTQRKGRTQANVGRQVRVSTTDDATQLLEMAVGLHQAGELARARGLYEQIIQRDPCHADALQFLGLACFQSGDGEQAVALIRRAIAQKPQVAPYHDNLGSVLESSGALEEALDAYLEATRLSGEDAERSFNMGVVLNRLGRNVEAELAYRKAIDLAPDDGGFHYNLANLLKADGRLEEAVGHYQQAIDSEQESADARNNLGNTLQALGRLDEAMLAYRGALKVRPNDINAHCNLANVLLDLNRWNEASNVIEQVIAENPLHVAAHSTLSKACIRLHRTSAAIEVCRKAIAENADFADAHCNLGLALRQARDIPGAIEALQTAIRIDPEFAEAHNSLGIVYMDGGDVERAMECFREALKLDPKMTASSLNMSRARRFGEQDLPEIARMEDLLEAGDISDAGRISLHFALGKMFDDCAAYDKAFEHFREANRYKCQYIRFDAEHDRRWGAKLLDVFTPAYFESHAGLGDPSERPVFIVGMPRSGTTLVEQILASHPQVYGAGELTTISDIACTLEKRGTGSTKYPDNIPSLDESALQWGARHYLDHLQTMDRQAARVTDKMPSNFFDLGLIAVMFPRTRIIHCRRDAMDVCLSNFVQKFAEGHHYSYDLSNTATYYRGYEQVMSHWREALPIQMFEVQYEELVEEQERISRALIDYIGLDWDDRCLAFHETKRAVGTASNWQVRQPIYKTARKRWKNYEKHLTGLRTELGYVEDA